MKIMDSDKKTLIASDGTPVRVRFVVNRRAHRLILRLDARLREAVAVAPSEQSLVEVEDFARSRIDWLARQISSLPETLLLAPGTMFNLRGEPCLISDEGKGRRARLVRGQDALTLYVPGDKETLGRRVMRFLHKEAKADFCHYVGLYCAALDVSARRISIKDTRSRWGSCTEDGKLAFSWRLILAPTHILAYVAAHECAHLREMNHSPRFWALVEKCRPDWRVERAWLRQNGSSLHAVAAL